MFAFGFTSLCVFPVAWQHGGALSVDISEKVVGLASHLFSCRSEWSVFGKRYSDMNICLLHHCLLTSLLYWSFQEISWLACRVQYQSAFDRFTTFSTNFTHTQKTFQSLRVFCRLFVKMPNICQNKFFFPYCIISQNLKICFVCFRQCLRIWNRLKCFAPSISIYHVWFKSERRRIYF